MDKNKIDNYLFKILYNTSLASAFELNEYDEIIYRLIEDDYVELNQGMNLYDIIHRDLVSNKFISYKQLDSSSGKYNYILDYMNINGNHKWTAYTLNRELFEKEFLRPYIELTLDKSKIEYESNKTHIKNMINHNKKMYKEIKEMEDDLSN